MAISGIETLYFRMKINGKLVWIALAGRRRKIFCPDQFTGDWLRRLIRQRGHGFACGVK